MTTMNTEKHTKKPKRKPRGKWEECLTYGRTGFEHDGYRDTAICQVVQSGPNKAKLKSHNEAYFRLNKCRIG